MKLLLSVLLSFASATLCVSSTGLESTQSRKDRPNHDPSSVIVQLKGEPVSTSPRTRPVGGRRIDFTSTRVDSYRSQLATLRNTFKHWLRTNAPKARITKEFDLALNAVTVQLNGEAAETLRGAPMVRQIGEQLLYYPLGSGQSTQDPDLGLILALEAWQVSGGAVGRGEGVKVAVIDSGIDISHPCFDDAAYPRQPQLGDKRFTNNKVVAAKAFSNKGGKQGISPAPVRSHGTHVAGTVGCNEGTAAVIGGVVIPYSISGVAPRVLLGNYNVFPEGVDSTRAEDLLDALETAYEDGFDIANLSLGADAKGAHDMLVTGINNLDQANMIIVAAAGNDGPGAFTMHSPASAARALAAGASSVPHFVGNAVVAGTNHFAALAGAFATVGSDLTAPLAVPTENGALHLACDALTTGSLAGRIAVVARGECNFTTKIRTAESAGALAVLVVNNRPGDPGLMANDGSPDQPGIPAYMIANADIQTLMALDGTPATIRAASEYFVTAGADVMFDLSGRGPTDVDFRVKPDVCAPGVNVLSSFPVANCGGDPCFEFMNGTSMAAPHLAGSAAVVRAQHPSWSAAQVRSAIVNTADRHVLKNYLSGASELDCNVTGSGRENLFAAVNASVALDPVSVSFGAVASGSGQSMTRTVKLRNISGRTAHFDVALEAGESDIAYAVSPNSVDLAPGMAANLTITMMAAKGASPTGVRGTLTVSAGGVEMAHAVVFTLVK